MIKTENKNLYLQLTDNYETGFVLFLSYIRTSTESEKVVSKQIAD